jgi:hypothetical protein
MFKTTQSIENLLECMKKAKIGPTFVRKAGQFLKRIDKENDLNKSVCVASKINCRQRAQHLGCYHLGATVFLCTKL